MNYRVQHRRAIFLDRDGVLNKCIVLNGKPFAPRTLRDFKLFPGTKNAVRTLKEQGFLLVVVTNQPDIGNGLVDASTVDAMHDRLRESIEIDDIRMCPHRQIDDCDCRKPRPGMLLAAARDHDIDLGNSYMVGDRVSDIMAGNAAGCFTAFIDRGYQEAAENPIQADITARSLPEAVRVIVSRLGVGHC